MRLRWHGLVTFLFGLVLTTTTTTTPVVLHGHYLPMVSLGCGVHAVEIDLIDDDDDDDGDDLLHTHANANGSSSFVLAYDEDEAADSDVDYDDDDESTMRAGLASAGDGVRDDAEGDDADIEVSLEEAVHKSHVLIRDDNDDNVDDNNDDDVVSDDVNGSGDDVGKADGVGNGDGGGDGGSGEDGGGEGDEVVALIVTTLDGTVYSLDADTGRFRWSLDTGGPLVSSHVTHDNDDDDADDDVDDENGDDASNKTTGGKMKNAADFLHHFASGVDDNDLSTLSTTGKGKGSGSGSGSGGGGGGGGGEVAAAAAAPLAFIPAVDGQLFAYSEVGPLFRFFLFSLVSIITCLCSATQCSFPPSTDSCLRTASRFRRPTAVCVQRVGPAVDGQLFTYSE
jgi:hypothetical protein